MKKQYTLDDFLSIHSAHSPAWTYDDTCIVYMSNKSGTVQLYLLRIETGNEIMLTNYEDGIIAFAVSPTENKLVFSKALGGNERAELYLLDIDTSHITKLTASQSARYNLGGWSADGVYVSYSSNERNGSDFDVYVLDIQAQSVRCVYDGGGASYARGISPSGEYMLVSRASSGTTNDIYMCNMQVMEYKKITNDTSARYLMGGWAPDSSAFYTCTDVDYDFLSVKKYEIHKGIWTTVYETHWNVQRVSLSDDGRDMVMLINEDGYLVSKLLRLDTRETIDLAIPKGNLSGLSFSHSGDLLVYSYGNARNARSIYIYDLQKKDARVVVRSTQGVPAEVLCEPELVRFSSFDGLSVPTFIYYPAHISNEKKLPVIIHIHGGPASQFIPTMTPFLQYLVYSGYVVVAPNIRGSAGYGKVYASLDDREKRMDSVKDIVALRAHLKTLPSVDEHKIVLRGGSYGGFVVYASLAFYPTLWAGGISVVGISDMITFLRNTAPFRRKNREMEYGSLEHDTALLRAISPIHKAECISAPLMIVHGANDPRVPLSEAHQMEESVRATGGDVELVVYHDEGHGVAKKKNKRDLYCRILRFLKRIDV